MADDDEGSSTHSFSIEQLIEHRTSFKTLATIKMVNTEKLQQKFLTLNTGISILFVSAGA